MAAKYKKRADGRYLIQIQLGIQDNGKPKYKNIYAHTIKELEEKAAVFRQELEKGIVIDDKNLTLEKWAKKWLELYKSNKEYYTYKMYESIINVHIIPSLGKYKLSELKAHHIQEMINQKSAIGLTRTLSKIKVTLNQILEQAVKNEFLYKNVMKSVDVPRSEKPKKRVLTEQEKTIIRGADLTLKQRTFLYTLLYAGLRRGEILALTKDDINLSDRTISVNKAIVIKSNQSEIKNAPKSESGNRIIPIVDDLYELFAEYIENVESIYVFPSTKNKLMSFNAFKRFWEKIIISLNYTAGGDSENKVIANDITPHIFRHTYATTLYYAGIDIKTAQYLMGHASMQMTMDIYTHLDLGKNYIAVNKLNHFISQQTTQKNTTIDDI